MSLFRFATRSLLASYFVADGLKAALDPEPLVDQAEPMAVRVHELAEHYLPADLAQRLPTKTATLVRVHGIVQVAGAVLMATGIFRRTGALLVGVCYGEKVFRNRHALLAGDWVSVTRELALLGGVVAQTKSTRKGRCGCCARRKAAKTARAEIRVANKAVVRAAKPAKTAGHASAVAA